MSRLFADTYFDVALLNQRDPDHPIVTEWLRDHGADEIVTTGWVINETANAFSSSHSRAACAAFLRELAHREGTFITPLSDDLQSRGLSLYESRPDKEWSLTDCISFVVMAEEGITAALTNDHHFEQAGFTALLKSQPE